MSGNSTNQQLGSDTKKNNLITQQRSSRQFGKCLEHGVKPIGNLNVNRRTFQIWCASGTVYLCVCVTHWLGQCKAIHENTPYI